MNYGKNGIAKKERELTSSVGRVQKKFGVILIKLLFVILIATGVCGISAGIGLARGIIDSAPSIDEIDATPTGYLSTVLDNQGNTIATLVASGSNRVYVTIDEIPINLQHAFVAIEDERFYEHNGIDIQGIVRAAFVGISHGGHFSEGASTITQQLLKNNVFTNWVSQTSLMDKLERKIQEQYLAVELEKVQDKDWIIENYLNTINLGQNTLGVQAASQRYFNKDVSELNLSECAVIASITQNPSKYNPVSNAKENAKRRKKVLGKMRDQGYINEAEYNEAIEDDVYSRIQLVNQSIANNATSYFVDKLTQQVAQDLIDKKGYTETQAYKLIYSCGLTINSTQDPHIQEICDQEVNNIENYGAEPEYSISLSFTVKKSDGTLKNYSEQTMLSFYKKRDNTYNINFGTTEAADAAVEQYMIDVLEEGDELVENSKSLSYTLQPQASLTVIDQYTGEVKAIVGGRGEKKASKTLNRATDTTRQPGSTFKILAAYAPALDAGGMTLATVEDDAPYSYANGKQLNNYDKKYRGFTTFRQAITNSINVVTVKAFDEVGMDVGYNYLLNFGFSTLVDADNVPSLCLGGITNGVTNLELTAAYATIANSGTYTEPRFYTTILDHEGNVILDNTPDTHTVLKESTAFLLTDAMKDVVTDGTGKIANFDGMPIAGKTGTTSKNKDALFAGYTPYYTCVVWGGYDDNTNLKVTSYPKKIWRSVMSRIHEGLEYREFKRPDDIVECSVCKKSGKLAVAGLCDCDPRGSMVETEYFAKGTEPTEVCDHHISATICSASGEIAGEFCPDGAKGTSVYIVGGSEGTDDSNYALDKSIGNGTCSIHTEAQHEVMDLQEEIAGEIQINEVSEQPDTSGEDLEEDKPEEDKKDKKQENGSE